MRVHFCGVRGSTPAPGAEFVRVGGHTSCVAVAHDTGPWRLILDAGTGIRMVTPLLGGEPFRGTILFGHIHLDHTQGLPFFTAADRDDAVVQVLLPEQGVEAETLFARCFSPPHFPISPRELNGQWTFDSIDVGVHQIEGFTVTALEVPHAGGRTLGYRIADETSSLAYLSDHRTGDAHDVRVAAMTLSSGVDVLIHDSQFTPEEQQRFAHYGHSTPDAALDLAERAHARRLVMFHHSPTRNDDQVEALAEGLGASEVEVLIGRDGLELQLP